MFDTAARRCNARGVAVYQRDVTCGPGWQRLEIGGLGLYGRVFWDETVLGECTGPYTPYSFDFETTAGCHVLTIVVDNRFSEERPTLMHPFADFYAFGGIYRSVMLSDLPERRIERVVVRTPDIKTGCVDLFVHTAGFTDGKHDFEISFDTGDAQTYQLNISADMAEISLHVPNFQVWSPDSPALHTVTVAADGDAAVERFGIRIVAVEGEQILLNGKPVRLLGVNRHESHPQFGPLAHPQLMLEDVMLAQDLGANFIRCVHYTQDPLFLDICDRAGILVWEESLGWGNPKEDAAHPLLRRAAIDDTVTMVQRNINHPIVLFWGFLNEGASDTQEMRALYSAITTAIRAVDPTRLVTFASNRGTRDICFEFADVISVNMYPGWIDSEWNTPCNDLVKPRIDEFVKWASEGTRTGKPLLMSEIGACGIYGMHDSGRAQWTEEFQADFLEEACNAVLNNPRFAGIALWQFFDTRSFVHVGHIRTKPFGMNLAGLLDAYRRPKLAYAKIREIFKRHGAISQTEKPTTIPAVGKHLRSNLRSDI
ncbi:MAG: hypothetical protein GX804_09555 [Lentisphaerae bacterium]|nr:hypothetical protein [Lentisphaerota bacterium]